jgi:hypothetical protein
MPATDRVAFVGGSLWVASPRGPIVRIDPATNQIVATIDLRLAHLVVINGELWAVSVSDTVPGSGSASVYRVDLDQNTLVPADLPAFDAVGLGWLWRISPDKGLKEIDASSGMVVRSWSDVRGWYVQEACGALWVASGDTPAAVRRFDPLTGQLGTPIPMAMGNEHVYEAGGVCYLILGNPGGGEGFEFEGTDSGTIALITADGLGWESPPINRRLHVAGDAFWTSTTAGVIQRIEPLAAEPIGHPWQLPTEDLPSNPKFVDWRLIDADGDLYLLTSASVYHLDIPTSP